MAERTAHFQAIGTRWSIAAQTSLDDTAWASLLVKVHQRIDEFDHNYSRFRDDSLVTHMQQPGTYELPADSAKLIDVYQQLYELSDGLVTPLIGRTLSEAGYDADYSLKPGQPVTPPRWEDTLVFAHDSVVIKQSALLDFGAAGKGYLVDIVGGVLHEAGIEHYIIDAGGDILHRQAADQAITVGLENPLDTSEVIGAVQLSNRSLCASAGSRRKWDKYHHIINPRTLESPRDIIATWVIADETIVADGLSTALFFVTPERLQTAFDFSYAILHHDMALQTSHDFPAVTYTAETV